MLSTLFLFIHLSFFVFLLFLVASFLTGAPFVPSRKRGVETMIKLAHIKPGMTVYDLGSGDGRILRAAEKRGAKAIGIEINPFLVLYSRMRGLDVRWKSLWTANISNADVVFVYLLPINMKKLEQKFERELRPGSLVVSNSFIFPKWNILRQDTKEHIYVFHVVQ